MVCVEEPWRRPSEILDDRLLPPAEPPGAAEQKGPAMTVRRRHLIAAAGGAALALPAIRTARAQSQLRFCLDWALQGNHAMWALADDRGVYRREQLSVRMDRGF